MVRPAKDLDAWWEADDVSGEPEWSVEDVEPMTLRHSPVDREKQRS
jgi:hypothetical protein